MRKIRAIRGFAGINYSAGPGMIITVHDGAAADLVRAGHAEYVTDVEQKPKKPGRPPKRRVGKRMIGKKSKPEPATEKVKVVAGVD